MPVKKKTIKTKKTVRKPKIINTMRGLNTSQQRIKHIMDMYSWGHAGIADYSELNKNVVPETTQHVRYGSLITLPPQYDVEHHDLPRNDITRYDIKSEDYVRIGGDSKKNVKSFAKWGFPILGRALSNDELNTLRLYYEYPSRNRIFRDNGRGEKVLGLTTSSIPDDPEDITLHNSVIEFHRDAMGDEPTLVHETMHAVRANEGVELRDEDKDEAFVELETLARISPHGYKQMQRLPGYYSFLTNSNEKMKQDRVLLTGGINKSLSGRNATNRVAEVFDKTNIYRIQQSKGVVVDRKVKNKKGKRTMRFVDVVPEWLDRSFEVVLAGNKRLNVHMRFKKPVTPGVIVTNLKQSYPTLVKVNEWMDGRRKTLYTKKPVKRVVKKTRVVSRIKKRATHR